MAAKDVSQLIRYEIDLAKTELQADVQRAGLAGGLAGVAAFVGCLVLVLLSIAFAFGLVALGIWTWAAFLIVAGWESLDPRVREPVRKPALGSGHGAMRYLPPIYPRTLYHQRRRRPHRAAVA